jgi:hypothetical protein
MGAVAHGSDTYQVASNKSSRARLRGRAQHKELFAVLSATAVGYLSLVTCHFARRSGRASWHLINFHNYIAARATHAGRFGAVVAWRERHQEHGVFALRVLDPKRAD